MGKQGRKMGDYGKTGGKTIGRFRRGIAMGCGRNGSKIGKERRSRCGNLGINEGDYWNFGMWGSVLRICLRRMSCNIDFLRYSLLALLTTPMLARVG